MSTAGMVPSVDRRALSFDRVSIRSRHHDEVIIYARIHCRFHAIDHFARVDECLTGTMTASLALHLIFQVHACGACADQFTRRSGKIEGRTETRIGIDQQRQRARARDPADVLANVIQRSDAEIR